MARIARRAGSVPAITGRALGSLLLIGFALMLVLPAGLAAGQTGPTTTTVPAPVATTPTAPPTTAPAPTAPAPTAPATTATTTPAPATPRAATQSSSDQVLPFVECSFRDPKTNRYNTVWGYATSRDRTIPIGSSNKFTKPAQNAGQPTTFRAGIQHNVFIVTHNGSTTWTLTGLTATAPESEKSCESNPVPIAASSWAGLVTIAVVTLFLGMLLWWRTRRRAGRL